MHVKLKEIRGYICHMEEASFIHVCMVYLFPSFAFNLGH